jgi:hypothetical protein
VSTEGEGKETSSGQALPIRSLLQGTIAMGLSVQRLIADPSTMKRMFTLPQTIKASKRLLDDGPRLTPGSRTRYNTGSWASSTSESEAASTSCGRFLSHGLSHQ